jgi:hypothetical protein
MTGVAVVHAWVRWRASAVVWAAHARRLGRRYPSLPSVLLVILGLGGGLAGASLIGEWCLGLVMIAESVGLIWVGWNRDDGAEPGVDTGSEALVERARRMAAGAL